MMSEAGYLPLLVRVVHRPDGSVEDVLGRDDSPTSKALVAVYIASGQPSSCFADWSIGGRRVGGTMAIQNYRVLVPQPDRTDVATAEAWKAHCEQRKSDYMAMWAAHEQRRSVSN